MLTKSILGKIGSAAMFRSGFHDFLYKRYFLLMFGNSILGIVKFGIRIFGIAKKTESNFILDTIITHLLILGKLTLGVVIGGI